MFTSEVSHEGGGGVKGFRAGTNGAGRNCALTSVAGALRARGLDETAILRELLAHPERRGLPEGECRAIARSASSWPTGAPRDFSRETFADAVAELAARRGWAVTALRNLGAVAKLDEVRIPMRNVKGEVTGWRRRRGNNQAFRDANKALTVKGGHNGFISPWPIPSEGPALLVEGEADAAAALSAGHTAVVATPGAQPGRQVVEAAQALLAGREVILAPDPDEAGRGWMARIGGALRAAGCRVRYVPPLPGEDLDKRLSRSTDPRAELARLIEAALPWTSPAGEADDVAASGVEDRAEVVIGTDEARVNDEVVEALARDPDLFRRGGSLVRIQPADETDGTPTIAEVSAALLRDIITRHVRFVVMRKATPTNLGAGEIVQADGQNLVKVATHPPTWSVSGVHQRGQWPNIRHLAGIAPCPCITESGQIVGAAGYDPATGLYLTDAPRLTVPSNPTADDVRSARVLLDDLFADFPFELACHRSAALAPLLTMLARPAIRGPAPLFPVDAPTQGTGKSLLVHTVFAVLTGTHAPLQPWPGSEEETQKVVTSIVRAGRPAVVFDNAQRPVGGASLALVLTATTYQDRILGQSELTPALPVRTVFFVTGNGLRFDRDCERRVIPVRLVPMLERPEERTGFRHPRLLAYAADHRPALLSAGLTILRGWWAAGCPDQHLPAFGSYEVWSGIVRNALVWAGWPDPFEAKVMLQAGNDSEVEPIRAVLALLREIDPSGYGVTAAEILEAAARDDAGEAAQSILALGRRRGDKPSALTLGQRLGRHRDRIIGGYRLRRLEKSMRGVLWTAESAPPAPVHDVHDVHDVVSASPRTEKANQNLSTGNERHARHNVMNGGTELDRELAEAMSSAPW
ncbi:MAG TPA: toprim domain-containing protein, partial [Candidatus Sumerlaeota bacterium]|nr:toprim domain-containing protein [Candidatus Sumerlaeota bacterium]